MIDIVYFGTDEYSAQTLEALATAGDFKIILAVTQPDRPVGRKQKLEKPPVKLMAEKYNIPVQQPSSLKTFQLPAATYQLNVVFRYGLIIPKNIIDFPTNGTLNVHPSLLPKYRGATPIPAAIMNGDSETGITIMQMDEKMDHGPLLAQEKFYIDPDDTYQTVSTKMTPAINTLLIQAIPRFISGDIKPQPQNESLATFSKMLTREDGKIDWQNSANTIYNQYRALTPWPGIWTIWNGKRLKLLGIKKTAEVLLPGQVKVDADRLLIGTGQGSIEVFELQLEGKKIMDTKTFISGYKNIHAAKLG